MCFTKQTSVLVLFGLILAYFQAGCTCGYEFNYKGQVLDEQERQSLAGVEIRTIEYDLYAIDPETYNQYAWGEAARSDSAGYYILVTSGMYDCGPGREDIDDPGDLGRIYFHFAKKGYVPVDTAFWGNSLPKRGSCWQIPTITMSRVDTVTAR